VVIYPDGITAEDRSTASALHRYTTVILPDCHALTDGQVVALEGYLDGGGTVVVVGRFGDNLDPRVREGLLLRPGVRQALLSNLDEMLPRGRQLMLGASCAANLHQLSNGDIALHLVNYDFDREADAVRSRSDVELRLSLPVGKRRATAITSDGSRMELDLDADHGSDGASSAHATTLPHLGVYTIVVFHDDDLA
jgi:hypothetical protein